MKNLLHLNKYFWKYRGRFSLGILFIVLSNLFNVYAPKLVGDGIDFLVSALRAKDIIENGQSTAEVALPESLSIAYSWFDHSNSALILRSDNFLPAVVRIGFLLAIGYFIFYLVKGIFLFYQRQTIIVMSRYIEFDLKNEIFDQYQRLDVSFYRKNRTGDLMNRISEDVNRVRMYLGPAVMYTLNLAVLVLMSVTVMWSIDPELTLYTLSPLPFMGIAIFYVSTIINRRTERVQHQQSALSTQVQESTGGIRLLRAFNREGHFVQVFTDASNEYKRRQLRLVKADALFMPVIALLVGLSTLLTIYIGSQKIMAGTLSYGVIVQFVFYVNLLTWPFASVGWVTSLVQKAEASQERINEFLRTESALDEQPDATEFQPGDIEFRHVSFTYPETGIEALKDISFTVREGETLAILGRTGSGKSTIAQLLIRLYDPGDGSILIGRKNIRTLHMASLRSAIGYVPQDSFLFSDTIRNNIAFGTAEPGEHQITEAAIRSDLDSAIRHFPKAYDTLLGERGINLSGGQKQRLSIARALIREPDILLLDDCLSAVDTQTEENILRELREMLKGRTSIIIGHRVSSVRHAHRIIVLDRGCIAEEGTHDELMKKNGIYASTFRKQQNETSQ